jgi:hypothetical protein
MPAHERARREAEGDDLGQRVARLEGTVEQIDGKVNWILGLVAACGVALIGLAAAIAEMLRKG